MFNRHLTKHLIHDNIRYMRMLIYNRSQILKIILFTLLCNVETRETRNYFFGFFRGPRPLSYSEVLSILAFFNNPVLCPSPFCFLCSFCGTPSDLKAKEREREREKVKERESAPGAYFNSLALGLTRNFR